MSGNGKRTYDADRKIYEPIGSQLKDDYTSLNIEAKPLKPHILAAATVVFGDDYYNGQRETISLSGFVQLNKWPMEGFDHRVDEGGHAMFDLELISAPEVGIKGFSYHLNDRIQVLSNPLLPNTGHVRQIVPGQNFPAHFHIRRFGILETSAMRLAHRDVINIDGVIDAIPPYKTPLTAPTLGVPRGDEPCTVVQAPNVARGTNLPEAWYPANDWNQPVGLTPSVFFADSPGPCMSMLVDPSMILQTTTEGDMTLELNGVREQIELAGDYRKAAGTEILLFDLEKTGEIGVKAQLARTALVGNSTALGGRVLLRSSFFKVSGGSLGDGSEESVQALRYPGDLHIDAHFEIVTPHGTLYARHPVHLYGRLKDLDPNGTELGINGSEAVLTDVAGEVKGRLSGLRLGLRDSVVSEEAFVTV